MTTETTVPAPEGVPPVRSRREAVLTWGRRVLVVLVLVGASYQLVVQWPEVSGALRTLPWYSLVLSFLAVAVALWIGPVVWRMVVSDLGSPVRLRNASMIYLVGQLGKYVPGSVWAFLLQMELAKAVGMTRVRSFTASLLTAGLGVVSALIAGVLALPVLLDGHREYLWIFVLLPFGLATLHPRVLTGIVSVALRLVRRPPLAHPLSGSVIARATGLGLVSYVLMGLHLWLLANSLGSPGIKGLALCVGTMSMAMAAGLVAFFLPSGIGAREVVIVAALCTALPAGPALTVALVSRLMFTVVDLALAGGAALIARRGGPAGSTAVST